MLASRFGHVNVCQILLEHGARVNARNNDGDTAIIFAVKGNHIDVVRILLEGIIAGAGPQLHEKETLERMNRVTDFEFPALLERIDAMWKELIDDTRADYNARASVNIIATSGLCIASQKGYFDIVKLLIDNGANVNAKSQRHAGETALVLATKNHHTNVVSLLLENGARTDILSGSEELTALDYACVRGYVDICRLLIANGANIPSVPLKTAALEGRAGMCTILRLCGMGGTWNAGDFRRFSYDVLNALNIQPMDKIVIEVRDMIVLDSINASAEEKDNSPPCTVNGKDNWVMRLDTVISYVNSGRNSPYGTPILTVTLLSNQDIIRINQKRELQLIDDQIDRSRCRAERCLRNNPNYQKALDILKRKFISHELTLQEDLEEQRRAAKRQRVESKSDSLHVQIQSLRF